MEERIKQRIVELEAIEQQHLDQLRAIRTVLPELYALLEAPIMTEGSEENGVETMRLSLDKNA